MSMIFYSCMLVGACFTTPVCATAVGSNTAVSQQALAVFPPADATNQMLGFAAFINGFTLNNAASCVYNSFYPIGGAVTLNGGTLSLSKDLTFQKGISFNNGGTILGNNRLITFQDADSVQLPVATTNPGSVAYLTQINTGKSVVSCDWSYDGNFLAAANSALLAFNIYSFNGSSISTALTQVQLASSNVARWHPSQYYLATGNSFLSLVENLQVWQYTPASNSISLASKQLLSTSIMALCWHPTGNYLAVGTAAGTNEIYVYSFSKGGLSLVATADLSPSRNISFNALSWDASGTYLVAGSAKSTGVGGDELIVYSFNGVSLTPNASSNVNIAVNAVSYSPVGNYVAIGIASGTSCLQIYAHNPLAGSLTLVSSASIAQALAVLSVDWSPDGKYIAFGTAKGKGAEFNIYAFDSVAQTLTLVYGFDTAIAANTVRWSEDGRFIAVGDASNYLSVYNFIPSGAATLTFNNAKLLFNSAVTFNVPTTFQGNCVIDGGNNIIQFGNQGSIIVASGATLTLKNLTLYNVTSSSLNVSPPTSSFYCSDDTSTVVFDNVELDLGLGDYNFNTGEFNVSGLVRIVGPYSFNYQSNQVSTINSNSTLYVEYGSKFNYNPSISSNSLLAFADSTASLVLRSATLQVSNAGLQLTKGYIEFDGKCYIVASGTQASQGLILGDGVSSANNVRARLCPEAQCLVSSGYIVDKSV